MAIGKTILEKTLLPKTTKYCHFKNSSPFSMHYDLKINKGRSRSANMYYEALRYFLETIVKKYVLRHFSVKNA